MKQITAYTQRYRHENQKLSVETKRKERIQKFVIILVKC